MDLQLQRINGMLIYSLETKAGPITFVVMLTVLWMQSLAHTRIVWRDAGRTLNSNGNWVILISFFFCEMDSQLFSYSWPIFGRLPPPLAFYFQSASWWENSGTDPKWYDWLLGLSAVLSIACSTIRYRLSVWLTHVTIFSTKIFHQLCVSPTTDIRSTWLHERMEHTFMNVWSQYVHKKLSKIVPTYGTYVHHQTNHVRSRSYMFMIIRWTYELHTPMNILQVRSWTYVAHVASDMFISWDERLLHMFNVLRRAYVEMCTICSPYVQRSHKTYVQHTISSLFIKHTVTVRPTCNAYVELYMILGVTWVQRMSYVHARTYNIGRVS